MPTIGGRARAPRGGAIDLLRLFADNLLPILLAAGVGYALAAILKSDPRPIAQLAFYVLAPCLIFEVITTSHVPLDAMLRMTGFALASLLGLGAIAALVVRWLGWPRPLGSAVVLAVLLPNAGNFGLSANLLAFGRPGLTQASLFFITSSVLSYTAGVFVVSLGRERLGAAAAGLARVPAIWAMALAFVISGTHRALPGPLAKTVELFSNASIPTFLIVLGMQLRAASLRGPLAPLALCSSLRLLGGAASGLLLAPLLHLEGAARQAGILQSSMPTAVISIILATEYDVEPGFVTSVVLLTTLLSPLTLTPLLAYLRG